jgi:hypothetical protein
LVHSFHRQALQELLAKITPPKQLEIDVSPAVQKTAKTEPTFKDQCREFGKQVAILVREKNLTKTEAVHELLGDGVADRPLKSLMAMVAPSNLGKRFHNKLFEGTKYVK